MKLVPRTSFICITGFPTLSSSDLKRSVCLAVAPGDELVERREIVVRSRRLADQVRDPRGQILVELVELRAEDLRRPLDLLRISSDPGAPVVENLVLAPQLVRLPLAVPDSGVLGDDAQGHLFATAADEDRERLTDRARVELRQTIHDHRHVAIEIPEARGRGAEFVPILLVI